MKTENLWTVEELSEFLRVPKSWVYERTRTGEIPMLRNTGRYKRFDPDVIKDWLNGSLTSELGRKTGRRKE